MLETLINPKKAERKPWEMFFIGALYAAISLFLADFLFLNNYVFEKHISILIVCFTVIFSIPFFFYIIKLEEKKDTKLQSERKILKEHGKAIAALLFLFLGYVVAFSLLFIAMPKNISNVNYKAQIETYCSINAKFNIEQCVSNLLTGNFGNIETKFPNIKEGMNRVSIILSNNFYVLLFSLLFSFLFGAGALFILAWNASVIAAAVATFTKNTLISLPAGLARYLVHGLPEIASYFIVALAGGIIGTAIIRHEFGSEKFWNVLQDSLDLIILALIVLIISAFIEVFVTPLFF
ncbi:MAG: stage II sporulation protein M [Candidatus Pacearchaeota archaeon]